MFMKTFEEKWTAWVDGELSGRELANSRRRCRTKLPPKRKKLDAQKLGAAFEGEMGART